MSTLGHNIKILRKNKGLTQEELASALSINRATLANWEIGRTEPDYDMLQKIADFFDVTVDYILGRNKKINDLIKLAKKKDGFISFPLPNLKQSRNKSKKTHIELLDILGGIVEDDFEVTYTGKNLSKEDVLKIIKALGNFKTSKPKITIPILGIIRAGIPILSEENYDGELDIPADIEADFALRVQGDSMIGAGIHEGDYAICRKTNSARSGDIVVALHDIASGICEATLKYYFKNNQPVLRAANPEYEDIPLEEGYRIAGIVVAILKKEPPPYQVFKDYIATKELNLEGWNDVIERAIQCGIKPDQVKGIIEMQWQMAQQASKSKGS